MRMCMKCWRSITESKIEADVLPPNYRITDGLFQNRYLYQCLLCGKGSNGYVEVDVPEGCLMVSRGVGV